MLRKGRKCDQNKLHASHVYSSPIVSLVLSNILINSSCFLVLIVICGYSRTSINHHSVICHRKKSIFLFCEAPVSCCKPKTKNISPKFVCFKERESVTTSLIVLIGGGIQELPGRGE